MPRRVQDIVPGDHHHLRDVRQPKEEHGGKASEEGRKVSLRRLNLTPPPPKKKRSRRAGYLALATVFVVFVVCLAGYAASIYFSRATFVIADRAVPVAVNATIVASGTTTPGFISYQVMRFSAAASTTVAASDGPLIMTKAQGSVTIYDVYSTQPQRLVAGTRLAGDSGLTYRLTGSVVVPGYKLSGGSMIPGTLVAAVVADQPGDEYDLAKASMPSDFKFVAYEGSPKYAGFYARLATDLTGGFSGAKKTISPATLAPSTAGLKAQLTARLLSMAKAAVPADSIMYASAYATDFAPPTVGSGSPHSAVVSEQGTLYAVLFKRADLVGKLAGQAAIASFGGFSYTTPGLDSLSFGIVNAKDFLPQKKSVLIAHLSGSIELLGTVPIAEIERKLAGLPLSATESVLRSYGQVIDIGKSSGELSPPWVSNVPSDQKRISIQVVSGS